MKKMVMFSLFLIVLSIISFKWINTIINIDKTNNSVKYEINHIIDDLEDELNYELLDVLHDIDYLVDSSNYELLFVNEDITSQIENNLYLTLKSNLIYRDIAFVNESGLEILRYIKKDKINRVSDNELKYLNNQLFVSQTNKIKSNEYYVTDVFKDNDGEFILVLTKSVYSSNDNYLGFIMITCDVRTFFEGLDALLLPEYELEIISDMTGEYVYKKDMSDDDLHYEFDIQNKYIHLSEHYYEDDKVFGKNKYVSFSNIKENSLVKGNTDFIYSIKSKKKLFGIPIGNIDILKLVSSLNFKFDCFILLCILLIIILNSKKHGSNIENNDKNILNNIHLIKNHVIEKNPNEEEYLEIICNLLQFVEESSNNINEESSGLHIYRVAEYSKFLAQKMSLSQNVVYSIHKYAKLHDIGKIYIPQKILHKKGPLTPNQFDEMKRHVKYGYELIKENKLGSIAENIIKYHHERWDGKGYLSGLIGKEIPIEARIVALADAYDSIRGDKMYRVGFSHQKALDIIRSEKGRQFDPELVAILIHENKYFDNIFENFSR